LDGAHAVLLRAHLSHGANATRRRSALFVGPRNSFQNGVSHLRWKHRREHDFTRPRVQAEGSTRLRSPVVVVNAREGVQHRCKDTHIKNVLRDEGHKLITAVRTDEDAHGGPMTEEADDRY